MKIKNGLIALIIIGAFLVNIPALSTHQSIVSDNKGSLDYSNNSVTNQEDETTDLFPMKDWISDESLYWKEKQKNDYLTSMFDEISKTSSLDGKNSKVSYSNYYTNQPVINIDVDKLFYKPGDTVHFVIQVTRNMQPETNFFVKLEIFNKADNFFSLHGGYFYRFDENLDPIKTITGSTNNQGIFSGSFLVSETGQYSLFISNQDYSSNYYYGPTAYRTITVSDLAMYSRMPYYYIPSQPIEGYSIILNGSSFEPLTNAQVNVSYYTFNWQDESTVLETSWMGQTDEYGKAYFSISTEFTTSYWGYLVITAKSGDLTASSVRSIWSSYYYQKSSGFEFVPTLDKPIYQPTETILGRVLVWNNEYLNATKSPATLEPISIQLLSPKGTLLMQFQRVTDIDGIVTFEIPLDESVELGEYKIIFSKDNFQQFITVKVDYYEKPAYRVNINLDKDYVPSGSFATGNVSVQYYFGKSVSNAKLELILTNSQGTSLHTVNGVTDAKGVYFFKIPVSVDEDNSQVTLTVHAQDPVGREVTAETDIVTTSGIYMWSWVYPWTPQAEDEITVSFYAFQGYNSMYYWRYWSPLIPMENVDVKITVRGVNTGFFGTINQSVKTLFAETNSYGYGHVSFTLPKPVVLAYQYFEISVELDIDDGRSGLAKTRLEYSKYYSEIEFDQTSYSKGDTVSFDVSIKDLAGNPGQANIRMSIFDSDYNTIVRGAKEITDTASFSFKLTNLAPSGVYTMYSHITYTVTDEFGSTYDKYVFGGYQSFKVGQETELTVTTDKDEYNAGDTISISGEITGGAIASPIYYEVSKRGIVISDAFSLTGNNFELLLDNSEYLAPRITVLISTFTSDGVILEQYKVINIDQALKLDISSDKEIYEPGEVANIKVTLKNGNNENVDGIAVISFVDSSIYGVQEDPEWEVDHFDENSYWSIMSTTTNWRGYQPGWYYYWYWFEDIAVLGGYFPGAPVTQTIADDVSFSGGIERTNSGGSQSIDTTQINIRDELPESINWQPRVFVPISGYDFNLTLPDNIGEWTVRVTAVKGQMGVLEKHTFVTQLPFFIEIDKPASALQDDIVTIKGIFYNYLSDDIVINATIDVDSAYILNREYQTIVIPKDYLAQIKWTVYLPDFGRLNTTIYAVTVLNGVTYSDAIRKPLIVLSNGLDEQMISSGFVTDKGVSISLNSYPETVSDSNYIVVSRGLNDVVLESWERLIGYPYGCLEQTMSKLLPDVLVKEYLSQKGELTDGISEKIDNMIVSGITRVYSMQKPNGGFGWWSDDSQSNNYMTAYAVYGLNKIKNSGYPVSDFVISQAINYLKNVQHSDGHWETNYWRMDNVGFTAFILKSLLSLSQADQAVLTSTISKAVNYIKNNWDSTSSSVYTAGLVLLATYNSNYWDQAFSDILLDYIINNQKSDQNGIFWSLDENDFYWRPLGGSVETTSIVLQALIELDVSAYNTIISSSIGWILNNQQPWGWSSTKGTSEAISTVISLLSHVNENSTGTVTLLVNGKQTKDFVLNEESDIKPFDFSSYLKPGENLIELTTSEGSEFTYYLNSKQVLRSDPKITFSDNLKVNPNQNLQIPIEINPNSQNVYLKNVSITLLEDSWANNSDKVISAPLLSSISSFDFNLQSGSNLGNKNIDGILVTYYLVNADGTKITSGLISQRFGPIAVEVTNQPIENTNKINNKVKNTYSEPNQKIKSVSDLFELTKAFSKLKDFTIGEFITVSLTVTSITGENQFVFIKDFIPTGFILDETSLASNSGISSYKVSSTGVNFFINSLSQGQVLELSYRLQVKENILASIAPSASISPMYDDQQISYSESFVLGNKMVKKNALGDIFRDLDLPSLLQYSYVSTKSNSVSLTVEASDDEGISQVNIYYRDKDWSNQNLDFTSGNSWFGELTDLSENEIPMYIEIHDNAGNVFVSDKFVIDVIVVTVIPLLIFSVFFLATISGIGGYTLVRKKIS